MPLHDYKCGKCGYIREVLDKYNEESDIWCPQCDFPMRKQISPSNFQLKGNGWYKTDFKNKK